ncbi:hypothetical protein CYY_002812 [Polysphondylium violaceum]|uniref:Transmembrane protein n=1 Tax=Polysphondylium violaceum TaxID=133409 RepID=A0A8J4PXX0_9MYCE|nr:hypothetical protein CYY_002812 [Polysphondylium violaceum]
MNKNILLILFVFIGPCFSSTQLKYYSNSKCDGVAYKTIDLDKCSMYGAIVTLENGIKWYKDKWLEQKCDESNDYNEYTYGNCYHDDTWEDSFFTVSNEPHKEIQGSCYSSISLSVDFKNGFTIMQTKNASCYKEQRDFNGNYYQSLICTPQKTTVLSCKDSICASCDVSNEIEHTQNDYEYSESYYSRNKYVEADSDTQNKSQKQSSDATALSGPCQLITIVLLLFYFCLF